MFDYLKNLLLQNYHTTLSLIRNSMDTRSVDQDRNNPSDSRIQAPCPCPLREPPRIPLGQDMSRQKFSLCVITVEQQRTHDDVIRKCPEN